MTIATSDSGGGAGIQADLKTFAVLGVHGTCAITAITAQNTLGVTDIMEIPPALVFAQIEAVIEHRGSTRRFARKHTARTTRTQPTRRGALRR